MVIIDVEGNSFPWFVVSREVSKDSTEETISSKTWFLCKACSSVSMVKGLKMGVKGFETIEVKPCEWSGIH